MNIVSTADLRRTYGEGETAVHALADVTLNFPAGQFTAIMGPSGSGKSTLMHLLAGLDKPTSGSVVIDGQELANLDDKGLTRLRRDRLGFVFQAFNLVPVLTAEENITLPLQLAGRKPDAEWLTKLIDTVGLSDRLTHRPSELSGGQQQRVAVARALVHRPAVVFADEPTGNLDSHASEEVLNLLRQAVDEFQQTVIMVTHDAQAAAVADRLVILNDGQVVHDGAGTDADGVHDLMKAVAYVQKVALKGLLSRKLRSVLTGFAVVIGVAFVVGTLVFTDTIDESFKNLFERTQQGVDVAIEAQQAVKADFSVPPTMPADTLDRVKAVPGVEAAEGSVSSDGTLLDKQGEPIVSQGPPTLLLSVSTEERFEVLDYESGRKPETDGEVVLDRGTSNKFGFNVGDTVTVAGTAPAKQFEVSGIASLGDTDNLGGARMIGFTLPEAQRMTGHDGYDSISVATGSADPDEVKAAIQRELGGDFLVRTGEEAAEQQAQDLSDALGFLRTALLVFAAVALLVGGFLIFNTFTVTVAQRTKEFALLRVLGASRAQVLRSVLVETLIVGLVASILGVLVGILLAPALAAMLSAFGIDLGTTGLVIKPMTIVIGLVIGVLATMVSGFVPARRATRIEPVAAMRDSVTPGVGRIRKRRVVGSLALMGVGVLVLFYGLFGDLETSAAASLLGVGAVLMMFGFAFLAPLLVQPLARVLGAPMAGNLTGRLARENAIRQPQRTAVTAAALMVGLALVVLVTVFAAGLTASVDKTIDDQVSAALIVQNQDGFSPIPGPVVDEVAKIPGVVDASPIRFGFGILDGETGNLAATGIDPATFNSVISLKWERGDAGTISAMTNSQAVVDAGWAKARDLAIGSTMNITTPTGDKVPYEITGTFNNQAGLTADVIVTGQSMLDQWDVKNVAFVMAAGEEGVDPEELATTANRALTAFPSADALSIDQFKDKQTAAVNQLLGLVFALLALSVIVALLGIVNTLALSVHERTRELGMLRAVGMSRNQVRWMVVGESVITAGIGAVLGTVLGVVFSLIVSRPLADQGFVFVLPIVWLIVFFILAAIAGVVAAIPPARRAAKVDVLRAVTTE